MSPPPPRTQSPRTLLFRTSHQPPRHPCRPSVHPPACVRLRRLAVMLPADRCAPAARHLDLRSARCGAPPPCGAPRRRAVRAARPQWAWRSPCRRPLPPHGRPGQPQRRPPWPWRCPPPYAPAGPGPGPARAQAAEVCTSIGYSISQVQCRRGGRAAREFPERPRRAGPLRAHQ